MVEIMLKILTAWMFLFSTAMSCLVLKRMFSKMTPPATKLFSKLSEHGDIAFTLVSKLKIGTYNHF